MFKSSKHKHKMELPAATNNSVQTFSLKNEIGQDDLFIPYQVQCALIRIFIELYPEVRTYTHSIKYQFNLKK